MLQITANISSGDKNFTEKYSRLNQFLVDRHIELGYNSKDLVIITDCKNYDQKNTLRIDPLNLDYFNFKVRHWNYINAIKILGLKNEDLLLRDSDTIVMEKFNFPKILDKIGFVRWKYGNLNCGAIYLSKNTFDFYEKMINKLELSYDEKWITNYMKNSNCLEILPETYNFDCRVGPKKNIFVNHVCRRFYGIISPEVENMLKKYSLMDLAGRKMNYFSRYKDI